MLGILYLFVVRNRVSVPTSIDTMSELTLHLKYFLHYPTLIPSSTSFNWNGPCASLGGGQRNSLLRMSTYSACCSSHIWPLGAKQMVQTRCKTGVAYVGARTHMKPFSRWHLSRVFLIRPPSFLKKSCSDGLAVLPGPLVWRYSLHSASARR